MGDWAIVIQGTGVHHNRNYPTDANRMAAGFVEALREAGHTVKSATFTSGGRDEIDGQAYIDARDEIERPREG